MSSLDSVLESLGTIPPLPDVVLDVLDMTSSDDASMEDLRAAVERDPILAGRVLQLSTSAYYGLANEVGSLKLALVVLGMQNLRQLVISVSTHEILKDDNAIPFMNRQYLIHSGRVAGLARSLGRGFHLNVGGEEFTTGLLHDIGKVAIGRTHGDTYARLLFEAAESGHPPLDRERDTFGFTHADASAALLQHWNLPKTICDAVHHHHGLQESSLEETAEPVLAALLRVSNAADHDDFSLGALETLRSANDDEAWTLIDGDGTVTTIDGRAQTLSSSLVQLPNDPAPLV